MFVPCVESLLQTRPSSLMAGGIVLLVCERSCGTLWHNMSKSLCIRCGHESNHFISAIKLKYWRPVCGDCLSIVRRHLLAQSKGKSYD